MLRTSRVIATAITPSEKASSRPVLTSADFAGGGRVLSAGPAGCPPSRICEEIPQEAEQTYLITSQVFPRIADAIAEWDPAHCSPLAGRACSRSRSSGNVLPVIIAAGVRAVDASRAVLRRSGRRLRRAARRRAGAPAPARAVLERRVRRDPRAHPDAGLQRRRRLGLFGAGDHGHGVVRPRGHRPRAAAPGCWSSRRAARCRWCSSGRRPTRSAGVTPRW